MATIRGKLWLLLWGLLLLAWTPAHAADQVPIDPLPTDIFDFDRFQPWAGWGIVEYGDHRPNQGYFLQVDWLNWFSNAPDYVPIGDETQAGEIVSDGSYMRPGINSLNTGMLVPSNATGWRADFGYAGDNWGWLGSVFSTNPFESYFNRSDSEIMFRDQYTNMNWNEITQTIIVDDQRIVLDSVGKESNVGLLDGFVTQRPLGTVDTNFNLNIQSGRYWDGNGDGVIDPTEPADSLPVPFFDLGDLRRLATVFRTVKVRNGSRAEGVELAPFFRTNLLHHGGYVDFLLGARYFRYTETFAVEGYGEFEPPDGDGTTSRSTSLFADSYWNTKSTNNIVGPQIGGRWSKKKGRWLLSAEGRYMAGFNWQTTNQIAHLETQQVPNANVTEGSALDPRILGNRGLNTFLAFTPRTAQYTRHQWEYSNLVEVRANLGYQVTKALVVQVGWTGIWADGIARPSSMVDYALPAMGIRDRNRQDIFIQGLNIGVVFNR